MAGELTLQQKQALALAEARKRAAAAGNQDAAPPDVRTEAQAAYDALPWYGQAAQAADDTVRFLANGMTLGYADKLAGYLGGEGTEAERAKTAQAKERAGLAGTAAEIVGTMLPAGALANSALSATRFAGNAGLMGRSAAMGVDGAALGAVQATGYDQDPLAGAGVGFASGFGGNLLGEGISAGMSKAAGAFNKKPQVMTAEQLKQTGGAAFDRAKNAGVIFKPESVGRLRDTVYNDMAEFGYDPALHPGAAVVFDRLTRLSEGGNVGMDGLQSVRKIAGRAYNPQNPENNKLLAMLTERLDDFAASAGPDDILTGNVKAATDALAEGRDYWSRFRKLEKVQDLVDAAERRAATTGSGGNIENATKQNLRKILDNKKMMRGFTPDEIKALEAAIFGVGGQNALRLVGKMSPQGSGLMAALGLGGAATMPQVAIPAMLLGAGAKATSDAITRSNVEAVKNLVAAGGSKSALEGSKNAFQRLTEAQRETLIRILMSGGLVAAGQE